MKVSELLIKIAEQNRTFGNSRNSHLPTVSAFGAEKLLRNTNSKKSTCMDKIPPDLIKLSVKTLSKLQWNLSKEDTYGTKVFARSREMSALERFELKSSQI